jgi:hypothetical protein
MGILEQGLQKATISMIMKTPKLRKIEIKHIIQQKLGNNPIDVFADNNVYHECSTPKIGNLIIAGFGEANDQGLSGTREIDYASYTTKMAVALKDVPLVKTNGPFSNITMDLQNFLHIWKKYYGSRTSQHMLNLKDLPINPFTVISSGITLNDRSLHFDMVIANIRLIDTNPGEMKYFGDLLLFASENIGFGSNYVNLDKYSANPEDRTTLSAFYGNPYGQKLVEAVDHSFETLSFIQAELEGIRPKLTTASYLLWVSNHFKHK